MTLENKSASDSAGEGMTSAHLEEPKSHSDETTQSADALASDISVSHNADIQERLRRADALRSAKRALELADQLKLVSLNVAIESAKTRNASVDLKRVKADLSTLTNQAVKASREIGGMIAAINTGEPIVSALESDFRKAVQLKKDLESILKQSKRVLDSIDRLESH